MFPHQQDLFPIKSVTKSSADENLAEKFKIFVQNFVPIRTAVTGWMFIRFNGAPHTWAGKYIYWAQNTDETVTRL